MEHYVFTFSLIIEGAKEKALQFMMSLKSNFATRILVSLIKNVILNTTERFKQERSL